MPDRVTANLPARKFSETAAFYGTLGFSVRFESDTWMIMSRGELEVEFFSHPQLNPAESWFSACVRIADLDALHRDWSRAELPNHGVPRMTAPSEQPFGQTMFSLVDVNGSLLRCLSPTRDE